MTKKIDPLSGMFSTFSAMKDKAIGMPIPGRDDVLNDSWDDITVDTCAAFDTMEWETGVLRLKTEDKWFIVEQYVSKDQAKVGHQKWVDQLKKNPKIELKDIDLWGLGI